MKRKNRKYSREYKIEAVHLCEEDERPVAEVARQLGINPNNLYKWRTQFSEEGEEAFPGKDNLHCSNEELRRLVQTATKQAVRLYKFNAGQKIE